LLANLVHRKLS